MVGMWNAIVFCESEPFRTCKPFRVSGKANIHSVYSGIIAQEFRDESRYTMDIDNSSREKRKYKKLSPADWASIEALYSSGGTTLAELSDEYGVSVRSIQLHLAKDGLKKGEAEAAVKEAAKARIVARAMPQAEALADRIRLARDTALADAEELQNFIRETLAEVRSGGTLLSVPARMRLADQAAHSLDRVHRLQRTILGMDKEAQAWEVELPELPIRVLTDEEVREIRAKQEAEDDDEWIEGPTGDHEPDDSDAIVEEG